MANQLPEYLQDSFIRKYCEYASVDTALTDEIIYWKEQLIANEDALEKMGVSEVETKTFDPNFHNAVMHIEDENFGESEIVEVFQKGYCKGDKVIRYAMVKVAN